MACLLYHVGGPSPCGQPALSVKRRHRLTTADDFPAENILKLDGTSPQRGEYVICGACRQPLHVSYLSYQAPSPSVPA